MPMPYLRAEVHYEFTAFSCSEQIPIVSLFTGLTTKIIKVLFGLLKIAENSNQDENKKSVSVLSGHISKLSSL